jgi:hypothetical protein
MECLFMFLLFSGFFRVDIFVPCGNTDVNGFYIAMSDDQSDVQFDSKGHQWLLDRPI